MLGSSELSDKAALLGRLRQSRDCPPPHPIQGDPAPKGTWGQCAPKGRATGLTESWMQEGREDGAKGLRSLRAGLMGLGMLFSTM